MSINVKKLSKKQIIGIVAAAIFVIAIAAGGIYCAVNDETPSQVINDIVKSDEELIIAKWQGEEAVNGYEFFEDGTYDNYLSTFSFSGQYSIDGNKLTLRNINAGGYVVYKFSINGDKLTLQLINDNGKATEDSEKLIFKKVKHFNMKSFLEVLEDEADKVKKEKEEAEKNGDTTSDTTETE